MDAVTLRAHFDGEQILLDEPFELKPNTQLIITVLSDQAIDAEHEAWTLFSQQGLADAYAEDEIEYTEDLLKEANPEYERR
jgi:hypothetical protein